MTTKHTPGPWHRDGFDLAAIIRLKFPIGHPECKHISGTYETIARCDGENWDANARLISASPDLFAFAECSAALDCGRADPRFDPLPVFRSHGWNGEENTGVFLARIRRAAIEKAVGHYLGRAA